METVADIFEAFGGYSGLATAISVPAGTSSAWKTRGSIPAEYWGDVVRAAEARGLSGVTYEFLARVAAPRRRRALAPTAVPAE